MPWASYRPRLLRPHRASACRTSRRGPPFVHLRDRRQCDANHAKASFRSAALMPRRFPPPWSIGGSRNEAVVTSPVNQPCRWQTPKNCHQFPSPSRKRPPKLRPQRHLSNVETDACFIVRDANGHALAYSPASAQQPRCSRAMRGLVTGPSRAYGVRGSCALNSASTS
jgi:hypothetical protein